MGRRMRDDELEAALRDVGRRLDHPSPAHMAVVVRERIHRAPARRARSRPLVPALATLLTLLVVVALALPGARATAEEFLRVRGIDIFRVPGVASALPSPALALPGDRTTLAEARRLAPFAVRAPSVSRLGAPDDVYVERTAGMERVTLVYGPRPGMPPSRLAGVSALVVELRGTVDAQLFGKAAGPGTRVEPVSVNGATGYWLEGQPHLFFYRDASGSVRDETLRLAGNTLLWEQGGVTLRLEAEIGRDEALEIAASFR